MPRRPARKLRPASMSTDALRFGPPHRRGDLKGVKQALASGADLNAGDIGRELEYAKWINLHSKRPTQVRPLLVSLISDWRPENISESCGDGIPSHRK